MSLLSDAFKERACDKVYKANPIHVEGLYQKFQEIANSKNSKPIVLDSIPHVGKKKKMKLSKMLLMMYLLNQSKKG